MIPHCRQVQAQNNRCHKRRNWGLKRDRHRYRCDSGGTGNPGKSAAAYSSNTALAQSAVGVIATLLTPSIGTLHQIGRAATVAIRTNLSAVALTILATLVAIMITTAVLTLIAIRVLTTDLTSAVIAFLAVYRATTSIVRANFASVTIIVATAIAASSIWTAMLPDLNNPPRHSTFGTSDRCTHQRSFGTGASASSSIRLLGRGARRQTATIITENCVWRANTLTLRPVFPP